MGFLITGTLLSVSLTGSENYGAQQMFEFTMTAVLSAVLAGVSLLLAFIVQARGTSAYENFGAVRAVKSMRRSTICILLAECCIYWSLLFFIVSLQSYILMCYVGPDICPYTRNEQPSRSSSCSQLGEDFYWAMQKSCDSGDIVEAEDDPLPDYRPDLVGKVLVIEGNTSQKRDRIDSGFVCSQYRLMQSVPLLLERPLSPKDFAVWGCTVYYDGAGSSIIASEDCGAPDHMQLINDVSEVLCSVKKATEMRLALCGAHTTTAEASARCAEAYIAYRKAIECVDRSLDDAKRCYQVCQWSDGKPNRERLVDNVTRMFNFIYVGLFVTFFGRLVRGLHQTFYVFATDDAPICKQILQQLFFRDTESSDEESDAEDPVERMSGRSGSSAGPSNERRLPKGRGSGDNRSTSRGPPRRSRRQREEWGEDLSASSGHAWDDAPSWSARDGRPSRTREVVSPQQLARVPARGVPPGVPRGWGPCASPGRQAAEPEPEAETLSTWSFW